MPTSHDDRRDIFHVAGTFCSWACVKAYNLGSRSYTRHIVDTVISKFRRRCTGEDRRVLPAPPWVALRAFGGTMSIDEFRACEACMVAVPRRLLLDVQRAQRAPPPARKRAGGGPRLEDDDVSFHDATAQNDMMRLRRSKHSKTKPRNTLMAAAGLRVVTAEPHGPQQ
jgi:hypothetical protein